MNEESIGSFDNSLMDALIDSSKPATATQSRARHRRRLKQVKSKSDTPKLVTTTRSLHRAFKFRIVGRKLLALQILWGRSVQRCKCYFKLPVQCILSSQGQFLSLAY